MGNLNSEKALQDVLHTIELLNEEHTLGHQPIATLSAIYDSLLERIRKHSIKLYPSLESRLEEGLSKAIIEYKQRQIRNIRGEVQTDLDDTVSAMTTSFKASLSGMVGMPTSSFTSKHRTSDEQRDMEEKLVAMLQAQADGLIYNPLSAHQQPSIDLSREVVKFPDNAGALLPTLPNYYWSAEDPGSSFTTREEYKDGHWVDVNDGSNPMFRKNRYEE